MNILNALNTLALVICVSGCGQAPSATESADIASANPNQAIPISQPVSDPTSSPTPSASPSPTSSPIAVTVYTKSTTVAPVNGFPGDFVTLTGSCVVYSGNTYCWDNGVQSITTTVSHLTTTSYYFFWTIGQMSVNGSLNICWGACPYDIMSVPTLIDTTLTNNIQSSFAVDHEAQSTPSAVISSGTQTHVSCTENNGLLDCGTFTIDTTQGGL
jgi:hypothetical protein